MAFRGAITMIVILYCSSPVLYKRPASDYVATTHHLQAGRIQFVGPPRQRELKPSIEKGQLLTRVLKARQNRDGVSLAKHNSGQQSYNPVSGSYEITAPSLRHTSPWSWRDNKKTLGY